MDCRTTGDGIGSERVSWFAAVGLLVFVLLSWVGAAAGLWKVLVVGWVAFAAMIGGAVLGSRSTSAGVHSRGLVWGSGLASGAMVTSAAAFLVPQAVGYRPEIGGFGIAAGLLVGYGGRLLGHRFDHDSPIGTTIAQLVAHTLTAGIVIGAVYTLLPEAGLLLGLSIVSHKGPAGYAAARRLRQRRRPVGTLVLPSVGVGVAAIPVGLLQFDPPMAVNAAVFGFAAGIFLHIAMEFLPECSGNGGSEAVSAPGGDSNGPLDRRRVHAAASTALGGGVVFVAWLLIT